MRKLWLNIVIAAVMLLSACSQAAPATPTPFAVATQNPNAVEMECTLVSADPTPGPTEASLFPPVTAEDWVLGNENAAMTVLVYSDFQCPYCSQLGPVVKELHEKHPDTVRVVFRHFPLPGHANALLAGQAAEAAGLQNKFWEMHDAIFANQQTWSSMPADQFAAWLEGQAESLGLDKAKFTQDMTSEAIVKKVQDAQEHGISIGLPGTPFVLVNGKMFPEGMPLTLASFESVLELFQMQQKQYTYCPPMQIDPSKEYIATFKTEKGDIVIQLFPDKAPMTVNSFVFLAREGWYNNVTFHRVISGFMAQAGDPSGTGFGGPGYAFRNETSDLTFDKAGVLAMANSGADTNGSQFFITYSPQERLNGGYTIFGQVIDGMANLEKLTPRDPAQAPDLPPGDKILSIEIKEQ